MGTAEVGLLERLFALAIGPYGGAFFLGLLVGLGICWWVLHKYYIPKKMESAEALCQARIDAIAKRLEVVEPVAKKWERFMERKAFEALGDKMESTHPGSGI